MTNEEEGSRGSKGLPDELISELELDIKNESSEGITFQDAGVRLAFLRNVELSAALARSMAVTYSHTDQGASVAKRMAGIVNPRIEIGGSAALVKLNESMKRMAEIVNPRLAVGGSAAIVNLNKSMKRIVEMTAPKFDASALLAVDESMKRMAEMAAPKFDSSALLAATEFSESMKRVAEMAAPKFDSSALLAATEFSESMKRVAEIAVSKFDVSALMGGNDFIEVLRRSTEILLPLVDATALKFASIMAKSAKQFSFTFPKFDDPSFFRLQRVLPANWNDGLNFDGLQDLIYRDGIPVVWVPPGDILDGLLLLQSREERVEYLLLNADLLLKDCRRVLAEVVSPALAGEQSLATKAAKAWKEHPESAQALAVNVADTLINACVKNQAMSTYEKIKDGVKQDLDEVPFRDVCRVFTLAAIHPFFSKWFSSSNDPMPSTLSRHVTVHNANPIHINPGNSLISILLLTSLLRTFQEDYAE